MREGPDLGSTLLPYYLSCSTKKIPFLVYPSHTSTREIPTLFIHSLEKDTRFRRTVQGSKHGKGEMY